MKITRRAHEEVFSCPTCREPFFGKYCAACGEKQVTHHDFTLPHFIEESIEGITHFDNKFFRSIRDMIASPGLLTRNFEEGRKVKFMKPVQLFIVCNVLFFLLVGESNIFAVHLDSYLGPSRGAFFDTGGYFIKKFGSDANLPQLTAIFQEKMANQSKSFIILFIPIFALWCALCFFRSKKPLGLHLVFATHFFSFLLFFFTLFHLLLELPNDWLFHIPAPSFNLFATLFNFGALVVYFTLAVHRFYKVRWLWAVFTGLSAGVLFIFLLQAYRVFLFYNIMRTL
ncbi:MAG TPA: DUF3667 domain-containing protein [Flavisolibacter sp.]|nr:DUF3667 domain-containing protein [Flavisolibacter sp.]